MNQLIKNPKRYVKTALVEPEYVRKGISKDSFLKSEASLKEEWRNFNIKKASISSGSSEEQLWLNNTAKFYDEELLKVSPEEHPHLEDGKDSLSLEKEANFINSEKIKVEDLNSSIKKNSFVEENDTLPELNVYDISPGQYGIVYDNNVIAVVDSEDDVLNTLEYLVFHKDSPYEVSLQELSVFFKLKISTGIILGK